MLVLTGAEAEFENLNNVILATEDWSELYKEDEKNLAKLIKVESRLETIMRRYFREMSDRAETFINWYGYQEMLRQISAADDLTVDVIIVDGPIDAEDAIFIQTVFDPIAQAVALGAQSGETLYSVELGLSETSAVVQKTAKEQVAELVGKKVDPDGKIINNPKAKYKISDKTRADIRQSISTSLSLGEDQATATERLKKTIKNPKRAATIARTETVNAYQRGLLSMGLESGAVAKEWQSVNDTDICGVNGNQGIIKINERFASGHLAPAAHPNCRCGLRLVYPEESDRL